MNKKYELFSIVLGVNSQLEILEGEAILKTDGNCLYFVDDGKLVSMNSGAKTVNELPNITDYKIITNGNNTKIVFQIVNDDHSSELYVGDINSGSVNNIKLFAKDERFIKTYDGCIDDNNLYVAMTTCELDSQLVCSDYSLSVIGMEQIESLATSYIYYEETNVTKGSNLTRSYDVVNDGNVDITGYNVVLCDENDNVLVSEQVIDSISIGETKIHEIEYCIPENFTKKNVVLKLKPLTNEKIYSEVETIIKHNDIQITDILIEKNCMDEYIVNCTVKNNGYEDASNTLLKLNDC